MGETRTARRIYMKSSFSDGLRLPRINVIQRDTALQPQSRHREWVSKNARSEGERSPHAFSLEAELFIEPDRWGIVWMTV
jgi:hypothetical protein